MGKTKAMVVLETIDYEIKNIVEKGPYVPIYQPMAKNAPVGLMKQTPTASYDDNDKRGLSLDVKAGAASGNSLTYHMYHLV